MPERQTRIRASQIANIRPSDITASATNSPSDGQVPKKADGEDRWTWVESSLDVQKDDTNIETDIGILNFEGSVRVINEGNKKVTVKVRRRNQIVV